ncbi:hypothetical protein AMTRI_Chr04g184150 [Amborella trichopoda]
MKKVLGHMEKFITHSILFSEINTTFEYMLKRTAFSTSFKWKSETSRSKKK